MALGQAAAAVVEALGVRVLEELDLGVAVQDLLAQDGRVPQGPLEHGAVRRAAPELAVLAGLAVRDVVDPEDARSRVDDRDRRLALLLEDLEDDHPPGVRRPAAGLAVQLVAGGVELLEQLVRRPSRGDAGLGDIGRRDAHGRQEDEDEAHDEGDDTAITHSHLLAR